MPGISTPSQKTGLAVGIADRLDSLAGLFAAGLAPTGNKDPFALRRAALGLVQSLIGWEQDFDLRAGLKLAAELQPVEADENSQQDCLEFIIGRMRSQLMDEGHKFDVVDAVLAGQGYNPASASKAVCRSEWICQPVKIGMRSCRPTRVACASPAISGAESGG